MLRVAVSAFAAGVSVASAVIFFATRDWWACFVWVLLALALALIAVQDFRKLRRP